MAFSFEDILANAVHLKKKQKPSSKYSKKDMGDKRKLYAYIKERVEVGFNDEGKHQFIHEDEEKGWGFKLSVYNTPVYIQVEGTGKTVTVKQFVNGEVSDWETREIILPIDFCVTGTPEKAMEALEGLVSADSYDDLPEKQQNFWEERALGLNKILNEEQPMVEAYARHLWKSDEKAQMISPSWIENVKDSNIPKEAKAKVGAIKTRLKNKASRELNFDKDTISE